MKRIHALCALVTSVIVLGTLLALAPVGTGSTHTMMPSPTMALASAGGGGGASGGGGGGGGSSSGSSGTGTSSYGGSSGHPVADLLSTLALPFVLAGGVIVFTAKLHARRRETLQDIRQAGKADASWSYKELKGRVEETFYALQNGWTKGDLSGLERYLSDRLLEEWQTRLEWMRVRHEHDVLKQIRLDSVVPVEMRDEVGQDRDCVWFYMKSHMVDYIEDTETGDFVRGITRPAKLVEWWRFTRKDDAWVLDRILSEKDGRQLLDGRLI